MKQKLLFICLGNICRSPAAHAVMQHLVNEAGLADKFEIDSAGLGSWHVGQLPDERMRRHGQRRGYKLDHRARVFSPREDFSHYDGIYVMDEENYRAVTSKANGPQEKDKVHRLAHYLTKHRAPTVPDPYYGGPEDFEYALDLIEDACGELLRQLSGV